jgi:hypothetical protein
MAMEAAPKWLAYVAASGGVRCFERQFRGDENLRLTRYMACHPLTDIEFFEGS